MTAHPELPKHNMLVMSLPQAFDNEVYNRSSALLVSEWLFFPAFRHPSLPTETALAKSRDSNILCLSGPVGSGKTQLAAHLAPWLAEMGCLGGYFTFDHGLGLGPTATLDALPLTLIHQAAAVEPDMCTHLATAFANNPTAAHQALERRFLSLFVAPVLSFVAARLPAGGAWNPLAPLVFIIDGLGAAEGHSAGMIGALAEWLAGSGVLALPPHIRFLLLTRPEVGLAAALRARQANCVYAEMEPEVHCTPGESLWMSESGVVLQAGEVPRVREAPLAHSPLALKGPV
ncbi:hypothetical protein HYPSUDRAFT_615380 [Hypholoma sublateritium FD-334 SS-4]|uniref:Nephrocystin 3-like N-terminal domain-containing protein n=1 Tax=Hypholoma sublateritium (strain FD-334 SS-4) TaxID=945553 RepID=A0A0D2LLC7_HYPSF|nr:hypothetical protein HYPSUDRAFT_615380 [Hypholoma sublateritium FD-334 SS-4]